jgi:hypothetical protein
MINPVNQIFGPLVMFFFPAGGVERTNMVFIFLSQFLYAKLQIWNV